MFLRCIDHNLTIQAIFFSLRKPFLLKLLHKKQCVQMATQLNFCAREITNTRQAYGGELNFLRQRNNKYTTLLDDMNNSRFPVGYFCTLMHMPGSYELTNGRLYAHGRLFRMRYPINQATAIKFI